MVNQDPQPELYTTRAVFTAANTTGDIATNTIFTNQAKIGVENAKVLSSLKLITVASKALDGILLGPT